MKKKPENQYLSILQLLWKILFEKAKGYSQTLDIKTIPVIAKKSILHKYKIKLFSLTVAILFSIYVIQQDVSEKNFTIPLVVKHAPDYALSENIPQQLILYITGAKNELLGLNINDIYAEIDLEEKMAGVYNYTPLVKGLDEEFRVLNLSPQKVTVSLSRLAKKRVRVEPEFVGRVKQNYSLNNYIISPSVVSISGPEDILEDLVVVQTESINVDNLDINKELEVDLSKSTHPSLRMIGASRFKIKIFVATKKVEKLITGKFLVHMPLLEEYGLKFATNYYVNEASVSIELSNKNPFVPLRDLYFYVDTAGITQAGEYRLRVLTRDIPGVVVSNISPKFISTVVVSTEELLEPSNVAPTSNSNNALPPDEVLEVLPNNSLEPQENSDFIN